MHYFFILIGIILVIAGLAGCIIPGLPGPPLNYAALLILQLTRIKPFTGHFLWTWAGITLIVLALDYLLPVLGAKKSGASQWGAWGSLAGVILGLFIFPPWGIIVGPFIGAVAVELLAGKKGAPALKAGLGSFFGFIISTIIKLSISGIMTYYFFQGLFR